MRICNDKYKQITVKQSVKSALWKTRSAERNSQITGGLCDAAEHRQDSNAVELTEQWVICIVGFRNCGSRDRPGFSHVQALKTDLFGGYFEYVLRYVNQSSAARVMQF